MVVKRIMIIIILFLLINMQGDKCIEKEEKPSKRENDAYMWAWKEGFNNTKKSILYDYSIRILIIIKNQTGINQIIKRYYKDSDCLTLSSTYSLSSGNTIAILGLANESFSISGYGCYNLEKIYPYLGQPDKKGLVRCTISTEFTCMAE